MREILFRGKTSETEWVYGDLIQEEELRPFIRENVNTATNDRFSNYFVYPDTIGQCTGLTDRNGKKIFEGDVVNLHHFFENIDGETLGVFEDEETFVAKIDIREYGVYFAGKECEDYLLEYVQEPEEEIEVIGNIHDNPELLKMEVTE